MFPVPGKGGEMKFATFDLELADDLPEDNWKDHRPLDISCAAVGYSEGPDKEVTTIVWQGDPILKPQDGLYIFDQLYRLKTSGYRIVTWNGCGFDFPVLSDLAKENFEKAERYIAHMTLAHIDMMLIVTFTKGFYLSLEAALKGAGIKGKLKELTLSDGSTITDMSGAKAPELWRKGEKEAVVEYLKQDVIQPLELAYIASERSQIKWKSQRGNPMVVGFPKLYSVRECFDLPKPDTSWMTDPPTREQFIDWMPKDIIKELA
jgi:hypothetical protein